MIHIALLWSANNQRIAMSIDIPLLWSWSGGTAINMPPRWGFRIFGYPVVYTHSASLGFFLFESRIIQIHLYC